MTVAADHTAGMSFRRVVDALAVAGLRPRERGWECSACCPVHEDRSPSLSVSWRDDRTLVNCHACGPAATEAIVAALGLTMADLFDQPLPPRQHPTGPSRTSRARSGVSKSTRKTDTVPREEAAGVAPIDTEPAARPVKLGKAVATYTYTDAEGTVLGEVRRYQPEGASKTFRAYRVDARGSLRPGRWADPVLYRLPQIAAATAAGQAVWLTEGEKDADALTAAGVCATSAPFGAKSQWDPAYSAQLAGADVVVVADRDEPGYARAATVAAALHAAARSVRVVQAASGKDAYDHLSAGHGIGAFADVPADVLAAASANTAAAADGGDGSAVVSLSRARARRNAPAPGQQALFLERDLYQIVDGHLARIKGKSAESLMNAAPRVIRRVRRDVGDGARVTVSHVDLEITHPDHPRDAPVVMENVEIDEFEKLLWVRDLPWPDVTAPLHPKGRSDVVNAIRSISGHEVPTITAYGAMGWRHVDGRWMYIHAGGAIDEHGPVGDVRVEVPGPLAGYTLPEPPDLQDAAALRDAFDASVALLERLPPRVAAPLLGGAYRALLGESQTTLYLVGSPGGYKTSCAAVALQHYVPTARYDRMPIPAGDDYATGPALEEIRYLAGHSLMVTDDLAPDRGAAASARRANALARSQYNQTGKFRSQREGGLRPVHRPRGLLVLTGEDGAGSSSAESRVLYVPLGAGDVDLDALKDVSTTAMAYGRAAWTAALARHVAARLPLDDLIDDQKARLHRALRDPDAAESGTEARRAGLVADLAVGWRIMLGAALDLHVITRDEAARYWQLAWEGLVEAKAVQLSVVANRTPHERVAELLRTLLTTGRVFVAARDGGAPDGSQRWGWPVGNSGWSESVGRPNGACVGWTDGEQLWLDGGAVFAALEAQARAESDELGMTKRSVGAALADAKVITVTVNKRGVREFRVRRNVGGRWQDVWETRAEWLWPEQPATPVTLTGHAPEPDPAPAAPPAPQPLWDDDESPAAPEPEVAPELGRSAHRRPDPGRSPVPAAKSPTTPATPAPAPDVGSEPEPEPDPEPEQLELAPPARPQPAAAAPIPAAPRPPAAIPVPAAVTAIPAQRTATEPAPPPAVAADARLVPAVVVGADAVVWADGHYEERAFTTLAELLDWAWTQPLGMRRRYGPPEDGQVWIMPEAADRLGIPGDPPRRRFADEEPEDAGDSAHPLTDLLEHAGWAATKPGPWMKVYPPDVPDRRLRLVLVGWNHPGTCTLLTPDPKTGTTPDAWSLACRIGEYARRVGIPFMVSDGVSGIELLQRLRPKGREIAVKEPIQPPPPSGRRYQAAMDFAWKRPPTAREARRGFIHFYDLNGMYLSACSSVWLPTGQARLVDSPRFDAKANQAAYWLIDPGPPLFELAPDPFDPIARGRGGPRWVPTPTLVQAADLGYELHPTQAWVFDGAHRVLEPWYQHLRDVRATLIDEGASYDPDLAAVLAAVKGTYAAGVGRFDANPPKDGEPNTSRFFLPYYRHAVMAAAGANLMRAVMRVADATGGRHTGGEFPAVVATDNLGYISDEPDPVKALPSGLVLGTRLGQVKIKGSAPLDLVLPDLKRPGSTPKAVAGIVKLVEEHTAQQQGVVGA